MNIVSLYDRPSGRGGTENLTLRLSVALEQKGHRFVCVLPGPSYNDRSWENHLSNVVVGPISSLSLRSLPKNLVRYVRFIFAIFSKEQPDVVLINWGPLGIITHLFKKLGLLKSTTAIIAYEPGGIGQGWADGKSLLYRWATSRGISSCDHVVVGGEDAADVFRKKLKVLASAVGSPIETSVPRIPRPSPDVFRILFVGRFQKQKRLDRLLKACAQLPRTINWELTIVGDGPDRTLLTTLADELGISNYCVWMGWHENPWDVVDSASILGFPSDYEGFSVAMVEALARGLPVLATDCEFGPRALMREGVNGWLVARDNVAFAEQLSRLVRGEIALPSSDEVCATVAYCQVDDVVDSFLAICEQTMSQVGRHEHSSREA